MTRFEFCRNRVHVCKRMGEIQKDIINTPSSSTYIYVVNFLTNLDPPIFQGLTFIGESACENRIS
jgi:hypothetical protein